MKVLLISLLAITTAQPAFSSDEFRDDIICSKINEPGAADNGLDIKIQSNPTAWVKQAVIVENGFVGPRRIGTFQIPLDQPKVSTPSFFNPNRIALYEVDGFVLRMEVADAAGQQVVGPAQATIELTNYETIEAEFTCERIR